jgi:hypothetical protein
MNYKPYTLNISDNNTRFQFQSVGKRGVFEKVIQFMQLSNGLYNLALLDYNPFTGDENDLSITDNGDMPEILATVMNATILFTTEFPDKTVYFRGSSKSRTRLYQISINKVYLDLQKDLTIYGSINNEWVPFEPNLSFDSFLIVKNVNNSD